MFDEENAVIKSLQKGERSNRNGKSGKKKVESKSVKRNIRQHLPLSTTAANALQLQGLHSIVSTGTHNTNQISQNNNWRRKL